MKDRSTLLERFHELEASGEVYGIRVDGAPVWPLLRTMLGFWAAREHLHSHAMHVPMGPWKRATTLAEGLLRSLQPFPRPSERPLLFHTAPAYQAITPEGIVDKFAHPLMAAGSSLGLPSVLLVRGRSMQQALVQVSGMHEVDMVAIERLASYRHWRRAPEPLMRIDGNGHLTKEIERTWGRPAVALLERSVHELRMHLHLRSRLLQRIRPRHVFVTCWYSLENIAMAHLCSTMGIPCTDLQHGVQGPAHTTYGAWHGIPSNGCSSIPSSFWCWDEASAANIRSWAPAGTHRPFVGGSPWLEQQARLSPEERHEAGGTILFSLQSLEQFIPPGLERMITGGPPDLDWVMRLHPNARYQEDLILQWADEQGIGHRVRVERPEEVPLGLSLQRAVLHVTQFSSVVREAALMGIRSVALSPEAAIMYPDLVGNGMLVVSSDTAVVRELASAGSPRAVEAERRPTVEARLQELMALDPLRT